MSVETLIDAWLKLPGKSFSRDAVLDQTGIHCDCSGFIALLCDQLGVPKPYGLENPKAVHYFAVLQEAGSSHISQVKPWSILAWRKETVPKRGDTGHVLLAAGEPRQLEACIYQLDVVDATKAHNGLSRRVINLHTSSQGKVIGVQLHLSEAKVKRCPVYHAPLLSKRYCLGCALPRKVCMCDHAEVSHLQPSIVILRHPDERRKTLSTVSLIKQRYPSVLVKEGETFNPLRREGLALLFPDSANHVNAGESQHASSDRGADCASQQTLIILDATWRKAKRMLHENGWLAVLPRVSLEPRQISDYLLRKVPGPNALATVEAFALAQNDPALQELFRAFMGKQIEVMGKDKYQKNYRDFINFKSTSRLP